MECRAAETPAVRFATGWCPPPGTLGWGWGTRPDPGRLARGARLDPRDWVSLAADGLRRHRISPGHRLPAGAAVPRLPDSFGLADQMAVSVPLGRRVQSSSIQVPARSWPPPRPGAVCRSDGPDGRIRASGQARTVLLHPGPCRVTAAAACWGSLSVGPARWAHPCPWAGSCSPSPSRPLHGLGCRHLVGQSSRAPCTRQAGSRCRLSLPAPSTYGPATAPGQAAQREASCFSLPCARQ